MDEETRIPEEIDKFFRCVKRLGQFSDQAAIGRAVINLSRSCRTLTFLQTEEGGIRCRAELQKGMALIETEGEDLWDALVQQFGGSRYKVCGGKCGLSKPLSAFGPLRGGRLGTNPNCRRCESERVRDYRKNKKG